MSTSTTAIAYSDLAPTQGEGTFRVGWNDYEEFSFRFSTGQIEKDSYTSNHPDGLQTWVSFETEVEVEVFHTSLQENDRFAPLKAKRTVNTSVQSWHIMEDEFPKGLPEYLAWKLVNSLYVNQTLPSVRGNRKYK